MNKSVLKKVASLCLASTMLFVVGCSSNNSTSNGDKVKVFTTITSLNDFASKIGGDKVEVNMVSSGGDAHSIDPTAQEIAAVSEGDVVFYSGFGIDDHILDLQQGTDTKFVNASEGITPIASTHDHDHANEETTDDHADHDHDDHDHGDDHSHEETTTTVDHAHEDDNAASYDAHVWQDPMNAKQQMRNIANELKTLDPDNAQYYEDNYNKYALMCDELDQKYKALTGQSIIVLHNAYNYIGERYDMTIYGVDVSSNAEITPAKLAETVDYANQYGINTIFYDEGSSDKNAATIANEIGGNTKTINPFGSVVNDKTDYFQVMEENFVAFTS